MHTHVRNGTLRYRQPSYKSHGVRYPPAVAQLGFQRARTEETSANVLWRWWKPRGRWLETGVASVTLYGRRQVAPTSLRCAATSLHKGAAALAAEGWARWSGTVCEQLASWGRCRTAGGRRHWPTVWPLIRCFVIWVANLHLDLEQEGCRIGCRGRDHIAAVIALVDAIGSALPALGRSGAFDILLALFRGRPPCGRSPSAGAAHRRLCRGSRARSPEWNSTLLLRLLAWVISYASACCCRDP